MEVHPETLSLERTLFDRPTFGRESAPAPRERQFVCRVRDRKGATHRRRIAAPTERTARERLWTQDLTVLDLREVKQKKARPGRDRNLSLFTRQISILLDAGIRIHEALASVYRQVPEGPLKAALLQARMAVRSGRKVHKALQEHPAIFPPQFLDLIRVGEQESRLEWAFRRLAQELEEEENLRRKVTGALTYPAVLMSVGVLIGWMICAFMLPKFSEVFSSLNTELPFATRALFAIAGFASHPASLILGAAAAFFGYRSFRTAVKTEQGRELWEKFRFGLPALGALQRKYHVSRAFRLLAALSQAGVPFDRQLMAAARSSNSLLVRRALLDVHVRVKWGTELPRAFDEHSALFGRFACSAIALACESGEYESFLRLVVTFAEREVESAIENCIALIEPMCLVLLGSAGGFVVMALFVPLYNCLMTLGA